MSEKEMTYVETAFAIQEILTKGMRRLMTQKGTGEDAWRQMLVEIGTLTAKTLPAETCIPASLSIEERIKAIVELDNSRGDICQPEQRLRIIAALDQAGVFRMRGGVPAVARELGISRYTVYNWLQKVHGDKLNNSIL